MNLKKKILFFISTLVFGIGGFAQSFTNMGKEFWVGYGHHQFMEQAYTNDQEMVLYLCTHEQAATVTVRIEGSGSPLPPPLGGPWTRTYTIPANTVVSIEDPMPIGVTVTTSPSSVPAIGPIPKGAPGQGFDARLVTPAPPIGTGGEGKFVKKGIHITSTAPIVAYAHIYGEVSSGATMLMPVETWGYNYTSINSAQRIADNAYSWLYVIAKENNTRVRITPSVNTRYYKPAGVSFDTTLQRGEIFQIIGALIDAENGLQLTGTTVKSIDNGTGVCYPVAVFAGSSRTGGESDCVAGTGRDNDMQQLFPEEAWGKNYLTAPWSNSDDPSSLMINMYKVAVKDPATVVKLNGVPLTGLIGNKYYYFESGTADHVESDQPVMMAQFASGGSPCSLGEGDPEMVYISPVEQSIHKVGFYRNTKEFIDVNYLTLIIPTTGVNTLKIDGTSFSAIPAASKYSYPHPNLAGYTVCVRRWLSAKTQSFVESDSNFTAITYGLGSAESYAYNAGTYINNLNAKTNLHNVLDTTRKSHSFTCVGTDVELSLLIAFNPSQIKWEMSYYPQISPNPGNLVSGDGVNVMPAEDSVLIENKMFYKYSVPGNPYRFDAVGTYNIPVSAKNPKSDLCDPFEKFFIDVTVKTKPDADFTFVQTGCPADGVSFEGNVTGNGYTVNQWFWQFLNGVPAADSIQKPVFTFPVSDTTYAVKLTSVSQEGCSADTVKNVTIPAGIKTSFTVTPSVCEGGAVTISPGPTTTTEWYWVFGDGQSDTLTNGNVFTHTYSDYGTYNIRHAIKGGGSCNSDTSSTIVAVYAKPFTDFTISPTGCLPANGVVQFTSAATAPDGTAIDANGYVWVFGNDTSYLADPQNVYTSFGSYPVKFKVSTEKGCTSDTTVNASFNVRPQISFSLPDAKKVCEGDAPFSIALAAITNGVPGTGVYKGAAIIDATAGTYNPALVPFSIDTVWYVFTSDGGCTDSAFVLVNVEAKPHPDFTFNTGCLAADGLVSFTNISTISTGASLNYKWDFGDLASLPADDTSIITSPVHNYKKEGSYSIKLHAEANGCGADTSITTVLSIKPALTAAAITGVCESDVPFALSFASVTNAVTGTGVYKGPGIINGAAGTFDPSVAGATLPGAPHTIWYLFTTAGGCLDSVSQTIGVSAKPRPNFSYTAGCLNPNELVSFTNASSIATGVAMTYSWNFGDAINSPSTNISADINPTHKYTEEGNYTIKLTAEANGCAADTSITASVSIKPALASVPVAGVCENIAPFVLSFASVTNAVAGTGVYKGKGIINEAAGTFDPSVAGATLPGAPHTIWYVFTTAGGCLDSVSQTIGVSAKPRPDFSYTAGCLAPDEPVSFTNASSIATGVAMTYSWNFGDAINSPSTNISADINPTHKYTEEGNYTIKLTAESNGCAADTIITAPVSIKPALASVPVAGVCENNAPFVLSFGSVANGVVGSYLYRGAGITDLATGTFDPSVAGSVSGNPHRLWYIFTTNGGCSDSISADISVYPVPSADFSINNNASTDICLDSSALIASRSIISSGTIKRWNWSFSNGEVYPPLLNDNAFIKYFANAGSTDINLFVVSDSGCTSPTVTKTINIRPLPVADFATASSVCMPGGIANFTNLSSIPDQTDLSYIWSFGDGTPALTTALPQHTFNSNLTLSVVSLVVASPFGCTADTTKTILFYSKPVANFSIAPDTLCQGSQSTFTDLSTVSNSSITRRTWTFSDGSAPSSAINPVITFANPGDFSVQLSVSSAGGCTADTSKPVKIYLQPKIDAGPSFLVPEGDTVTFIPVVNSANLSFVWTPAIGLSSPTVLRPTAKATVTQTYTLTATGEGNCKSADTLTLRVTRPIKIPNAFSPNGDGINDTWVLTHLNDYPNSVVEVFNRFGKSVFSVAGGYAKAWDGKYNGSVLPVGTYYYIINLRDGSAPYSGYVAIIR